MAEMKRGVSVRLGVDDTGAKRRIQEFGNDGAEALRKVEAAGEGSSRGLRQLERAVEGVRRQADPLAAAQQRLAQQTATYNAAVRRGIATEEERARVLGQLQQRYDAFAAQQARAIASTNRMVVANDNAFVASGRLGNAVQQAGFQVGDFAIQVASGQNAMIAFAQQATQLLGFFGPKGVIASVALAVAAAVGTFWTMRDATEEATDAVDEWNISTGLAAINAETLINSNTRAALSFRNITIEAKQADLEQKRIRQSQLNDQIIDAQNRRRQLQEMVPEWALDAESWLQENMPGVFLPDSPLEAMEEEARELSKEIGKAQTEIGKLRNVTLAHAAEANESAEATSRQATETAKATQSVSDYITGLREQNALLALEADEREVVLEIRKAEAIARENGIELTKAEREEVRRLVDARQDLRDERTAEKRAADEQARQQRQALERQQRQHDEMINNVTNYAAGDFEEFPDDALADPEIGATLTEILQ